MFYLDKFLVFLNIIASRVRPLLVAFGAGPFNAKGAPQPPETVQIEIQLNPPHPRPKIYELVDIYAHDVGLIP